MGSTTVSSDVTEGVGLPVSSRTFDAVVAVFSLLTVAGIAADFRSHAAGISFAEEGFFTAEHVFFYSAFLVVAVTLFAGTAHRRSRGLDWVAAVPPGYRWGIVGVLVFGFGGVGDFFWHSAFGFEESFEALVSPSHLTLAVGSVLFLLSPLRAAARRGEDADTAFGAVPVVVSMTLALAILGMFGGFVNPLVRPYPHFEWESMRSVVTMLVAWPLVYVGAVVATLRRFDLVPGAFTVAFGVAAFAIVQVEGYVWLLVPAVVAGVLADVFAVYVRRVGIGRALRSRAFTAFAAGLPAAFVTVYFTVVDLTVGIDHSYLQEGLFNWSIHVVVGAVVLAALVGVLFASVVADGRAAVTTEEVS
ncbi:hypothetical protein [Halorubellus litoreus]|uniref:Uncharacterized protein n=1 Tax=Halorubellus litoreus TaxID=755308 RepID=A0ABD5V8P8_9EURY